MEAQEINLEEDKKYKPKTSPQISPELYAKWLTDKYNKEIENYKKAICDLSDIIKVQAQQINSYKDVKDLKRLKYMNDKNEFSKELMKDDTILKYKREVVDLHKAIKRLRDDNSRLVTENLKLKNLIKNEESHI